MAGKIATYIGDLLYENEIVIVPSFGGFVSSYKSSGIDHVQGLLYPPSKLISFDDNLVVNDGLLVSKIRKEENCSMAEAKAQLEMFVAAVKKSLVDREIVVFPEVGRLYFDYEENTQFLPDSVNYNTAVYGLPTVQYYPILRSQESTQSDAKEPVVITEKKQIVVEQQKRQKRWARLLRPAVPYILAGFVVLAGIGSYAYLDHKGYQPKGVKLENLNLSPTKSKQPVIEVEEKLDEDDIDAMISAEEEVEDADWAAQLDAEKKAREAAILNAEIKEETEKVVATKPILKETITRSESIDTEGATLRPDQSYAIIIVHAFGSPENVRRMMQKLFEKGYQPYQDKYKGLTRVGVQMEYDNEAELNRNLLEIKKKINKGAYLLEEKQIGK